MVEAEDLAALDENLYKEFVVCDDNNKVDWILPEN